MAAMTSQCQSCSQRPAVTTYGGRRLCGVCAQRRAVTSAWPFVGAALAAAGLIAGSALLAEKMQGEGSESPLDSLGKRMRGGTPTLGAYSRDLTQLARDGKLDPVIGRDEEIERVVSILARRSKNNPCLVGEPEGRVKRILDEVKRSARDVVLFIDELHTLVGAGAAEGAPLDLSTMIKPELARGDLQCIGATTFDEYRKYIESDAALERRFQPVMVEEPSIDETIEILRGLRERYARHHHVTIDEGAIATAAQLAARYIADRFMPDKAIDLMDEAAASVTLANKGAVEQPRVTSADVASVVTRWTGIPQSSLTESQASRLLELERLLAARVIGQDRAIAAVSDAIRRARTGLHDPRKPLGSFLFRGPSGVGKTELAKALAEVLFGSEAALVRIDLSEFTEPHTVSRLLGAPPGYAGHDEAGQLTEPVRRRPYCVVLFDELEKAHPDVAAILLQILDDGRVTDAKGRTIDFRHTLIILTTNLQDDEVPIAFRSELLNRIDEIVPFEELGLPQIEAIVTIHVDALARRLGARNVTLNLSDEAKLYLARVSMGAGSGARYVQRTVSHYVSTPLSTALLRGELRDGSGADVVLDGDVLRVRAA